MPEQSTTPDLVELTRSWLEAMDRDWDLDAVMRFFAPNVVWDLSATGLGTYEGAAAVREFFESWWATWEDHHHCVEEIRDFGHGVVYVVLREDGRLVGTSTPVEQRNVSVQEWAHGKVVRITIFGGRREARAAAERLAAEREYAVSENLDLVRSIYANWEAGDFGVADWADPEIEYLRVDGPEPGTWSGLAGIAEAARAYLDAWDDFRFVADEYRELDEQCVLVLYHVFGHGKASGLELGQMRTQAAHVWHLREGKVVKLVIYLDRERALADLGLEE